MTTHYTRMTCCVPVVVGSNPIDREASRDRDLAMVGEAGPAMEECFSLDEDDSSLLVWIRHINPNCHQDRGALRAVGLSV